MAVASVAVELGPRNRRRLAHGTIALGVLCAIVVAAVLLARSPNESSTALSGHGGLSGTNAGLSFGMTPQQVRHLAGQPTTIQGSCWFFHPTRTGMVGSIAVQRSFANVPYNPQTTGDLKLCFLAGVYSYAYLNERNEYSKAWTWAPWPLPLSWYFKNIHPNA